MNCFNTKLLPLLRCISGAVAPKISRKFLSYGHFTNNLNVRTPTKFLSVNHFSITQDNQKDIVSFDEFKNLTNDNSTLIIDVREPQELKDTGVIPGSINIPLGEIEDVLKKLSNEKFKETYGREKPGVNSKVVFTCLKGVRSQSAMETAKKLGIKNSLNYIGGWSEWVEKTKLK